MFDVAMAERVLGYIEAHPEQHDQENWGHQNECGTTMCFAGWVATAEVGARMIFDEVGVAHRATLPDGRIEFIDYIAQDALGASSGQARILFYSSKNLDDLRTTVKDIANGDIV